MNDLVIPPPPAPQKLTEDQCAALVDAWKAARRLLLDGCLAVLPLETTIGALVAMGTVDAATRGDARRVREALAAIEAPPASVGPWVEIDNGWARRSKVGEWRARVLMWQAGSPSVFKWELFGPNGRVTSDLANTPERARNDADAVARLLGVALG